MDYSFFSAINGLAGRWPWLDLIGKFFGGDYFLFVFALWVILLWFYKPLRRQVYLGLVSAGFGRAVIVEILKRIVDRPRPFELETGMSFPSGHATIYFALAFAFWGTRYFWPFMILAVLGATARVFVGVHYPLDVLAGAVIAGLTVFGIRTLFKNRFLS
ncbi:MAG: phosphatase PAP2 family protein [Candidatus Doudnabacteria bacterium]|nr:phosphatase PAP2 family protein [Candidatus Doudnabacteria bacterium]